jgi:hypothetical protein
MLYRRQTLQTRGPGATSLTWVILAKYFAYKHMQSYFSLLLPQLLRDHDSNNLILH